jgi:hypothetical protein
VQSAGVFWLLGEDLPIKRLSLRKLPRLMVPKGALECLFDIQLRHRRLAPRTGTGFHSSFSKT